MENTDNFENSNEDLPERKNENNMKGHSIQKIDLSTLPITLKVEQIAEIMGIGRVTAYNLVHQKGFPTKKISRRIVIPTQAFLDWLNKK